MRRAGDPWRSIADLDHIHVRLVDLPESAGGGALIRLEHGDVWILLDRALTRPDRRAVLAHELEHLRRGSCRWDGAPASWAAVVAGEERAIDRAVAQQLVPLDELRAFAGRRSTVQAVTAECVAEEFDVPVSVAREACRLAS